MKKITTILYFFSLIIFVCVYVSVAVYFVGNKQAEMSKQNFKENCYEEKNNNDRGFYINNNSIFFKNVL